VGAWGAPENISIASHHLGGGNAYAYFVRTKIMTTTILTAGADNFVGTGGNDDINGKGGNDVIFAGFGDDKIIGAGGDDKIYAGDGNDVAFGGFGDDNLAMGKGDDVAYGDDGNDVLNGAAGNDDLAGGKGNDVVNGGSGDDNLIGGQGDDIFIGGSGSDTFHFQASHTGDNIIRDFTSGEDIINLNTFGMEFGDLTITYDGGRAIVDFGEFADITITMSNIAEGSLSAEDFNFGEVEPLLDVVG